MPLIIELNPDWFRTDQQWSGSELMIDFKNGIGVKKTYVIECIYGEPWKYFTDGSVKKADYDQNNNYMCETESNNSSAEEQK